MAFNTQAEADAEKLLFQNKYTALPSEDSDDNTQYFKNQYGEKYYYDPDANRYVRSETNEGDAQYNTGSREYLASLYSKYGLDPSMMRGGEEMSRPTEINGGLYVPVRSGYFDPNAGYDNFSPAIKAARAAALKNVYIDSEGNTFAKPQDVEKTNKMIAPYLPPKQDFLSKYGVGAISALVLGPIAAAAGGAGLGAALAEGAGALSATEAATLYELTGLPEYAAATGSGLGTAAEVVNDGTFMEDLLGPAQSPAPPSSLVQQLVDAGVPFEIAKYLPSNASLTKTLIQQGIKLANSGGSGSSRPQAGGLPNSGDGSSSGVSGSFSNPFPDAPTSGASPIKSYLTPTGLSTGAPSQSSMYAGLDPKLVNILSQRAAHGGQIHPRLQQVLSDRGYEINPVDEANPVEMVAGPENRYYARHAKRGFAVNGKGTGQSDDIPTMLADGEYVFDSDTVSALGDGSSKAGAAALDKMREEIRKHKRSAPVDKIPPKAKSPLDYLVRKGNKHG